MFLTFGIFHIYIFSDIFCISIPVHQPAFARMVGLTKILVLSVLTFE